MRVAVIGVGAMGSALAGRLLDSGCEVTVCNRTPEKCAPLVARGARQALTARDAAEQAQFVLLCLNGASIVESVVFGSEGVAAVADSQKLLLDFSSIDPGRTRDMSARLRSASGMGWVDAPSSGGAAATAVGALTLMLGGEAEDVAHAAPLLQLLSRNFTHLGPCGAGQTVKLVNQILVASAFIAVAEATHFAELQGIDATRIPAALAGGRADSRILQEFMAAFAQRTDSRSGRIDNMLKDLVAVEAAASFEGASLRLTHLITELNRGLVGRGFGAADNTAYMRLFD
ncbi:MAG: NAD(P)-dependent oxidoreductase [Casimicrobiaceae bacterium]